MAKIEDVRLKVEFDAVNEDKIIVQVDYDIEFSDLDRCGKVVYHETCRLVGVDTEGSGDVGNGGDDLLGPALLDRETPTPTGSQTTVHRTLRKTISRQLANEDPSPLQPRDELRADVLMADKAGQVITATGRSAVLADRF